MQNGKVISKLNHKHCVHYPKCKSMILYLFAKITMLSHLNSNYESEFSEIKIDTFLILKLLVLKQTAI